VKSVALKWSNELNSLDIRGLAGVFPFPNVFKELKPRGFTLAGFRG
jgi:hypothetical protein